MASSSRRQQTQLQQKLSDKRATLLARTAIILQCTETEAEALFRIERQSSFRINLLKAVDQIKLRSDLEQLGWHGEQSAFYDQGYSVETGRSELINSDLVKSGQLFIQNQASWLPVLALDPQPNERILDVCAAPGGKASHIAELTNNAAELVVNDNSRARLFKLRANFDRLGARYAEQTMVGIERLTRTFLAESFDKILIDAPCSGEGLINIDKPKEFTYWSLSQIKRLQQLQKKAIMNAWQLLKPGGTLVYSTCTMAPEENELVIDYLLRKHDDAELRHLPWDLPNKVPTVQTWNNKPIASDLTNCLRLKPSPTIEAFFVAKLTKTI